MFITRLIDESGARMTGVSAASGRCGAVTARRSCTNCRARIGSAPSSRISTTDESPSTDFERIVATHGNPLSPDSTGSVTRFSTSAEVRPGASVWISMSGGANSGNTSSGMRRAC
jgi:hypothetical protein